MVKYKLLYTERMTFMRIEEYLQELTDLLEDSWNLPLVKGKAFVDVDRVKEIAVNIREAFPNELSQAKAIVADRTQIVNDAKEEAENIIKTAKDKADIILSKDEKVKKAEAAAEKIVNEAKINSKNIKRAANDYIENLIKNTDKMLMNNINEFRNDCHNIRASYTN